MRLQFQKPVSFPPWESADSNFHTNLYEARKSHSIIPNLFTSATLLLGCFWVVSRRFTDIKYWISLSLKFIEAGKYMNVLCLAIFWSGMLPVPL